MLGRIQAEVAVTRQPADVLAAANQPAEVQRRAQRAHLECNVASALALQSPQEWRRWLVTYVRQLAADEDEVGWLTVCMITSHDDDQAACMIPRYINTIEPVILHNINQILA